MAITVSNTGYIKRTAITTYRNQRRGGKGRIGMRTREEDFVSHLFVASTHAYIMIFTDRGRAYWLKVHEIPDVGPGGKGKSIANLVSMEDGEKIAAMLAVKEFERRQVHRHGLAQGRGEEDGAVGVQQPARRRHHRDGRGRRRRGDRGAGDSDGTGEVFIGTRDGMAIRFGEDDVRPMGRTAYGVRGITLRDEDYVVAMEVVKPGGTLLTVTGGRLRQAHRNRRIPRAVARRRRRHQHRHDDEERAGGRRRLRAGGRRAAAHHPAGHDPADADQRRPRHRPRHAGRAAHRVEEDDRVVSIARLAERDEDINE